MIGPAAVDPCGVRRHHEAPLSVCRFDPTSRLEALSSRTLATGGTAATGGSSVTSDWLPVPAPTSSTSKSCARQRPDRTASTASPHDMTAPFSTTNAWRCCSSDISLTVRRSEASASTPRGPTRAQRDLRLPTASDEPRSGFRRVGPAARRRRSTAHAPAVRRSCSRPARGFTRATSTIRPTRRCDAQLAVTGDGLNRHHR